MRRLTPAIALLLVTTALAGCLGNVDDTVADDKLSLGDFGDEADVADDEGRLRVFVQNTASGGYESAETTVADPVASPAGSSTGLSMDAPDGHVDLASEDPVEVASGGVAAGDMSSIAFTLTDLHGTYDGDSYELSDLGERVSLATPVPVDAGSTTTVILGVDLAAAGDPATGFEPQWSILGARQDGESLEIDTENASTAPKGEPPVARAEVFNGTGVKVYESNFEAEGGETEAVAKHETLTWTARPSDDPDGAVESFEWRFSDGSTVEGKTVEHAFDTGGIHSATLAVTDDVGNEDTISLEIPVRYLVSEDGVDLHNGSASGSFAAGADDVAPSQSQDSYRNEHTFEIPEVQRFGEGSGDGSGSDDGTSEDTNGPEDGTIPIHGGGHGAGDTENPETVRRLAQASFVLDWTGEESAYTLQVLREGEVLAEESGENGTLEVEVTQLDGWYLDGGNYTAEVQFDQGVDSDYELDVTGTYIPIPTK